MPPKCLATSPPPPAPGKWQETPQKAKNAAEQAEARARAKVYADGLKTKKEQLSASLHEMRLSPPKLSKQGRSKSQG